MSKIIKHYKFKSDADFARHLGIKPQVLSNWKSRNTYDAELLYTKCFDLNPEWILTGQGEMLKSDRKPGANTGREPYLIPFYEDVESIGGRGEVANMNGITKNTEMIDAGDWFPGVTAAIRHYGDSMREYPAGCILALRLINDKEEFVPGKNYVIETREDRVTKRMQLADREGYVMLYSSNTDTYPDGRLRHEPYPVKKENIVRLFLVLGRIVKENSSGPVHTK